MTDCIDAYYEYGNLYFKSYYWANQIFNLNKYYREATTDDIKDFCSNECFSIDDIDSVAESCNNWTRRKIAYILDSGVLENNSVDEIIKSAKNLNLKIDINEENKIIFPDDKDLQKELLSYLAEEIYRGNLTDGVYLTNSKRPL
ncbi:Kiwa anti-phage protein KwaB-like domain-containing protein [Peptoniphilus rhinitidis]|uniref:Kiwa anti-phage protein KwaB-like domain-containing protein n=1 Tax=Peptoniphilus rhinitidis TaxID=1175452 RepID=UPI003B5B6019